MASKQRQQLGDNCPSPDTRTEYVICTNEVQRRKEFVNAFFKQFYKLLLIDTIEFIFFFNEHSFLFVLCLGPATDEMNENFP